MFSHTSGAQSVFPTERKPRSAGRRSLQHPYSFQKTKLPPTPSNPPLSEQAIYCFHSCLFSFKLDPFSSWWSWSRGSKQEMANFHEIWYLIQLPGTIKGVHIIEWRLSVLMIHDLKVWWPDQRTWASLNMVEIANHEDKHLRQEKQAPVLIDSPAFGRFCIYHLISCLSRQLPRVLSSAMWAVL